ncbi:MAG TPA: glycosyl hydrolase family 8, partial [Candidatus Saccharimonadales bacterium]|nr:glycosyl hydrolase family 8 [Candidatus Saccharimonadales bacterium]
IYLILYAKQRLLIILLSAVTFGIAVLSKENAVFFLPFLAWLVSRELHSKQIIFGVIQWIFIAGAIISLYPLYALLKTELFPTGTLLGGTAPHVSLLGSLQFQSSRGTGLPFWNPRSDFGYNFVYWMNTDRLIMLLGSACFVIQGIFAFFHKKSRIVFLLTLPMFLFLASGKLVINFYVIPLIPLLGLCIAQTFMLFIKLMKRLHISIAILFGVVIIVSVIGYYVQNTRFKGTLTINETAYQQQAVQWVKTNIDPSKTIAIDYYANLDLQDQRYAGDKIFPKAYWYWKVDFDPDIKVKQLHNNSRNINYFLLTSQMYRDITTYDKTQSLLAQALNNSSMIQFFGKDSMRNENLKSYATTHPNGDWVAVYKQNTLDDILSQTWTSYKKSFISSQGQIIDPHTHQTDSRQVGYTLLRTVEQNDKKTFDIVFGWAKTNMYLPKKSLFATSFGKKSDGSNGIINDGTTTDADQIIAYSLILATNKWHSHTYTDIAKPVIMSIWDNETALVDKTRYIVAGDWTSQKNNETFVVNPSEISPLYYRTFANIDRDHDWNSVVSSSYDVLIACSAADYGEKNTYFLPPNWCNISKSGIISAATQVDKKSTNYSYEAYRVAWNIASDYAVSYDTRDLSYLSSMNLWQTTWQKEHRIYANYTHTGVPINKDESLGQYASLLTDFVFINPDAARDMYDKKIAPEFTNDYASSYWGDKNSLFDQNWIWLCLNLYNKVQ